VKQAEALVSLGLRTSKKGVYVTPGAKAYAGLMAPFAPG
jgi:allantoin racemase